MERMVLESGEEVQALVFKVGVDHLLLVNSASGAIDIVPTRLLHTDRGAVKTELAARGYFMTAAERAARFRALSETSARHDQNIPYWFYISMTDACNFACPICYERRFLRKGQEIDRPALDAIFADIGERQAAASIPQNRMYVVVFGGEPLCVGDRSLIRRVLESVARRGWRAVIVTNGSLVDQYLDLFSEFREAIADFRITLDGSSAVHDARRPYLGGRGSFDAVSHSVSLLLERRLPVKMQTILGAGNIAVLDELVAALDGRGWLDSPYFQWRIEGSHDYANLDAVKDELSEGKMVASLVRLWDRFPRLRGKIKFESFKYLGHIARSFGWLGEYKTYWGPRFGFCEPQKGFHFVYSAGGLIYHCPRSIGDKRFLIGGAGDDPSLKAKFRRSALDRGECISCEMNTLCGGGCLVQKAAHSKFDCRSYAAGILEEFIALMTDRIIVRSRPDRLVSVNQPW
jgi:uncharacterized protein